MPADLGPKKDDDEEGPLLEAEPIGIGAEAPKLNSVGTSTTDPKPTKTRLPPAARCDSTRTVCSLEVAGARRQLEEGKC